MSGGIDHEWRRGRSASTEDSARDARLCRVTRTAEVTKMTTQLSNKAPILMKWFAGLALALGAGTAEAQWMNFTGGPTVSVGTWNSGSDVSGTATVTASSFVNGNLSTPAIGL